MPTSGDVEEEAKKYLDTEKEVSEVSDAIQGAQDIISEWISDHPDYRKAILSDGVTESFVGQEFIERDGFIELMRQYMDYHMTKFLNEFSDTCQKCFAFQ